MPGDEGGKKRTRYGTRRRVMEVLGRESERVMGRRVPKQIRPR